MARLPRLSLPGFPHYVIQRGNNGQTVFSTSADYQALLQWLGDSARKFDVAVHAYALLGNHFQLLATPRSADALSQMMQALGRRYVRYFNDSYARSGSLWEGRYRSALIQADEYLLDCMASIDLSPVIPGLAGDASAYPWSSHGHYAGLRTDPLVTPHDLYWMLGNTPFEREAAYAERIRSGLSAQRQTALADAVRSGWPLGNAEFVADLQKLTSRRLNKSLPGRPTRLASQSG